MRRFPPLSFRRRQGDTRTMNRKPTGAASAIRDVVGHSRQPSRRRQSGRVTIADVAERAQVSPMTVSRALKNPAQVLPEARARVEAAVAALGYVPNHAARTLASSRSCVVGV